MLDARQEEARAAYAEANMKTVSPLQVDKSLHEEFPSLFEDEGEDEAAAPAEEEDEGLDTLDSDLEAALEEELLKARGTLETMQHNLPA